VLLRADVRDARITEIELASRYGNVTIAARGFVDAAALSSVRVMGPCAAMGAGAAHALDLAGRDSVHDIDLNRLHGRLAANVGAR
jgi:hypothetical protein